MKRFLLILLALSLAGAASAQSGSDYHEKGQEFEDKKNYTEAIKWYEKAIDAGYDSETYLGIIYQFYLNNPSKALPWYKKGAEKGCASSMRLIAECYHDGEGVAANAAQAIHWFKRTGLAYEDLAKGDPDSWNKRVFYAYHKAAKLGDKESALKVADYYATGMGCTQDLAEASSWRQKAGSSSSGLASASSSSYAATGSTVKFFPLLGLTLGKSTYADAKRQRFEVSSSCKTCYQKEDVAFWDHNRDGIFECIYFVGKIPAEWATQGMSYSMSYDQWLGFFRNMGFQIEILESPTSKSYSGRMTLSAKVKAIAPNNKFNVKLNFNYGDNSTVTANNTLYGIIVESTSGKTDSDYAFIPGGSSPVSNFASATPAIPAAPVVDTKVFSGFAKKYVEDRINKWQIKGEFEKTAAWQLRVNERTRNTQIARLTQEAEKAYIAEHTNNLIFKSGLSLGAYDADNEVYLINHPTLGRMLVPVPIDRAPRFKEKFAVIRVDPEYFIENDRIAVAKATFTIAPTEPLYRYSNQASINYTIAKVDYNFDPIEIEATTSQPRGSQTISQTKVAIGKADVDINIPTTTLRNDKTFAVILANEHYQRESKVDFAANDGKIFREYCIRTLGLPETNVRLVANATLNNMRAEIDWITKVANAYNGEAKILVYYAGHGIPDESTQEAYLLPVDGYGSNVTTGYKLSDLYAKLSACNAQSAVVFLDACFSGAQRNGQMLASARGVAIRARQDVPTGKLIVFSAAQGDETAYPYAEKGHGMFTYFLLKKLQESKGSATLGEIGLYVTDNVTRRSIVDNSKSQTPSIASAQSLTGSWQSLKLK